MEVGSAEVRVEAALRRAFEHPRRGETPPRLMAAMRAAVFGRGARLRPHLCLAVAEACGDDRPLLAESAAAAVELLHCASLVHDDMPCFDDAAERRGQPSVHRAWGEPAALLAGDALVVLAFEQVSRLEGEPAERLVAVMRVIAGGVSHAGGVIGGQAWELEPRAELRRYHAAKTGALFEAAAAAGAMAAGSDAEPWRRVARLLGEAYQVADDLADAGGDAATLGKPTGRDAALGRPSAFAELGAAGARARLESLGRSALEAVPAVAGRAGVQQLLRRALTRMAPREVEVARAPVAAAGVR